MTYRTPNEKKIWWQGYIYGAGLIFVIALVAVQCAL